MSKYSRFFIGGIGGFLPILVTFVTIDIAAFAIIIDKGQLSTGICAGYAIKVICLFVIDSIFAAGNSDVTNPKSCPGRAHRNRFPSSQPSMFPVGGTRCHFR